MAKSRAHRLSLEVRERAVRLVREQLPHHPSQWAAISAIAPKLGCTKETLRRWLLRAEQDAGERSGPTSRDADRLAALERENRELKRANDILRKASAFFAAAGCPLRDAPFGMPPSGARPPHVLMYAFIDEERALYGVEPICRVLAIAPSGYYTSRAREQDPTRRPARAQRDDLLREEVQRVWERNRGVYGVRKVRQQLLRDGQTVARCTVARLMAAEGLRGVVRGQRHRTTLADTTAELAQDLVQRHFHAERPNQLWVADFTYVATWRGFVYVAFVIDVFSRRIVGWRAHTTMRTDLVLDALEQALHDRLLDGDLVVHSDRVSPYVSMRYTGRLAAAGAAPSVGSVGDAYDNALAETVIGLFKTEVIHRDGPWRGFEDVEMATLEWVAWFNQERLLAPLGYVPPAEFEAQFYETQNTHTAVGVLN